MEEGGTFADFLPSQGMGGGGAHRHSLRKLVWWSDGRGEGGGMRSILFLKRGIREDAGMAGFIWHLGHGWFNSTQTFKNRTQTKWWTADRGVLHD